MQCSEGQQPPLQRSLTAPPCHGRGAPPGRPPPPPKAKAAPRAPSRTATVSTARGAPPQSDAGPPLRPLFWAKLSQAPEDCLWDEAPPPAVFDASVLERRFALAKSASKGAAQRSGSFDEPRKRVRVLDDRTSQLLAISFNKLPAPERLAKIIDSLELFPEALPPDALKALHKAAQEQHETLEQLRQLALPVGSLTQLDAPERYLWVLATVPHCMQKLECGALLVGSARELRDLRLAFQDVGVCCQALRRSKLLRKCISTSLAVGNALNRGTSRSDASAVVLPEGLIKLDELKGIADLGVKRPNLAQRANSDHGAPSLLDFVVQAIVKEAGGDRYGDLRSEAQSLLARARAACAVPLEESEASCKAICETAARAQRGLTGIPETPGVRALAARIRLVCEEADLAALLVRGAKDELRVTQNWSSARPGLNGGDWFSGWAHFLEQLVAALTRAEPSAAMTAASPRTALIEIQVPAAAQQQCSQGLPGAKMHVQTVGHNFQQSSELKASTTSLARRARSAGPLSQFNGKENSMS
mmetsp:Transcript_137003/g.266609  ORF Transcript_137003/g.266609 Transcript_137003/m.266609 type:complete len:531 (+) Transcript_137003:13-1605(+)